MEQEVQECLLGWATRPVLVPLPSWAGHPASSHDQLGSSEPWALGKAGRTVLARPCLPRSPAWVELRPCLCLSTATYMCAGQASQEGRCPGLAPWRPQRLLRVAYLGPVAAPGSSRPVMARPQQLAATLMLRWPRCSLSIWVCVRSCRWLGPLGWAEMVRSRWFRERRKSLWPGRPKLPLRKAMRVAVFRAGRAR